jgi:hypothetical protein
MKKLLIALATALVLSACASGPSLSTADRLALYQSHAGQPVQGFQLPRNFRWTGLGDQAIAVWGLGNQGHLLEMRTRCSGLGFASRIHITNSMGRVSARFDRVTPLNSTGTNLQQTSCTIWTIRPLDVASINDAQREMREAETVERPADLVEEKE